MDALREGGAATFYLHHFAEIVANENAFGDLTLAEIRNRASQACIYLRTEGQPSADISLLGDIADALKHARLTRRLEERAVAANDAVIVVGTGYGELPYGEGKYGGPEQVIVRTTSGARALSAVLQNCVDAWRRVLGDTLPDFGQ